jgi:hypothetical protein
MADESERWPAGRVTGNSALLAGYIYGALSRDEVYRAVEADAAEGEGIIEHRLSGNRYLLHVVQISGTE